MDKIKLLTFSVIALLLLNLGTLGFLLLSGGKGHHPPKNHGPEGRPKPKEIIIEKLHFDVQQIVEYDKIIKVHQVKIRSLDDSIRSTKEELYDLLTKDIIDEKAKTSLFDNLSSYQKQIESAHFNHFQDIKKLCKEDQLDDYNDLTEELGRLFSKKPPPPRND